MATDNSIIDEWELALDKKLLELQECQQKQNLKSCFECPLVLECQLRTEYVKSVYESMSKGSTGGFEF